MKLDRIDECVINKHLGQARYHLCALDAFCDYLIKHNKPIPDDAKFELQELSDRVHDLHIRMTK